MRHFKFYRNIFILIIFTFLFYISDAFALPVSMTLNNFLFENLWIEGGRNNTLRITSVDSYPDVTDVQKYSYGYVKFCARVEIPSWYSGNTNYANRIDIYDTQLSCKGPNWPFTGTLRVLTFQIPSWNCSVQGTNCYYDNTIVFYQQSSTDYYVLDAGIVDQPIEVDYSSGEIINQNNQIINSNNQINNSLNDDNVDGANSEFSDFFSSFSSNTHGLTGIITAPLSAITSLTSNSCSPLTIPLPFVNDDITLPCMRDIYVQHFGGFMTIYDTIVLGVLSYWIIVKIFALVKEFKDPEQDKIEVVDL